MTKTELAQRSVLELLVNNHPGVMATICGLFARRAFNVEGIMCMPVGDGGKSRLWLLVNEDARLDQLEKQLMKLVDVLELKHHGADHKVFENLATCLAAVNATFADVVVFLATVSLAAALLYPAWNAREFRGRVATAVADIETPYSRSRHAATPIATTSPSVAYA